MTSHPELAIKSSNRERAEQVLGDALRTAFSDHSLKVMRVGREAVALAVLSAAYDSHSLAIAELEAKLATARNEALREVAELAAELADEWRDDDMGPAAVYIARKIRNRLTQPDRSQDRQAVIEAAYALVHSWGTLRFSFSSTEHRLTLAVQALTEPKPSADRIDPAQGNSRVPGGAKP